MEVTYKRNLYKSYMCVKAQEDVQEEYELLMLERQSIPGLLPMQAAMADGVRVYLYEISGKQQVGDYLTGRKIDYGILQRLLFSIQELCRILPDYLLREEGLCLEFPFIYVNLEDGSLCFTYLPFWKRSLPEAFGAFMEQVLRSMDHQDKAAIDLGYQIYQMCTKDNANIGNMLEAALGRREAWEDLQGRGVTGFGEREDIEKGIGRRAGKEENRRQAPGGHRAILGNKGGGNMQQRGEAEHNNWKARLIHKMDALPQFLRDAFSRFQKGGCARQELEHKKFRDERVREYRMPAEEPLKEDCADGILGPCSKRKDRFDDMAWKRGSQEGVSMEPETGQTEMEVELKEPQVSSLRGIPKEYFQEGKEEEPQVRPVRGIPKEYFCEGGSVGESDRESETSACTDAIFNNGLQKGNVQRKDEDSCQGSFSIVEKEEARGGKEKRRWSKKREKPGLDAPNPLSSNGEGQGSAKEPPKYATEILADFGQQPEGILVYQGNHGCPDLIVDRTEFLVGKNKGQVNGMIEARGISRLHARIIQEGNAYYIEDLNSTNGTYLNGIPLEYHQRMELCRDDHIRFGGEEYVFC